MHQIMDNNGYVNPGHSTEVWEKADTEILKLTQLKVSNLSFPAQLSLFGISISGTHMHRIRVSFPQGSGWWLCNYFNIVGSSLGRKNGGWINAYSVMNLKQKE